MSDIIYSLREGYEPLPGYRLANKRGEGGYGQVWEASGPGGKSVALKIMATDRVAGGTIKEIRSIQSIQKIYHPKLTRVYGVWSISGAIVVSMELADCSLHDVLGREREAGSKGLSTDCLLDYMGQAAEVLDFLNARRHIIDGRRVSVQHADVKPSNFLLFGNGLKVADYGLSRVLSTPQTVFNPAGTAAYAAPEVFARKLTEHSDQFSLAVTYCVLRTGKLPYKSSPPRSFAEALSPPEVDLSMVSAAERPALQRAMARIPSQRWPTCGAFVEELGSRLGGTPRFGGMRFDTQSAPAAVGAFRR